MHVGRRTAEGATAEEALGEVLAAVETLVPGAREA
jgi:hypothetical protein